MQTLQNKTSTCDEKPFTQHNTTRFTCLTTPQRYKCHCNFQTNFLVNLIRHFDSPPAILNCKNCHFATASRFLLLKHKLDCSSKNPKKSKKTYKPIFCEHCPFRTQRTNRLRTHVAANHPQYTTQWLYCDRSPYKTTEHYILSRHILRKHTPGYGFQCTHCDYRNKLKFRVKAHIQVVHAPPEEIEWFKCASCPFQTKWKLVLKKHTMLKHTAIVKWFECEHCEYKAKQKHVLKNHVIAKHESAEKIWWFECAHCEYKAKRKGHLVRHMLRRHKTDDEIKWFECNECSYRAKQADALKKHVLCRHTSDEDIKWFKCERCEFKAKTKSSLLSHIAARHTVLTDDS